jgi:hypothetical protein
VIGDNGRTVQFLQEGNEFDDTSHLCSAKKDVKGPDRKHDNLQSTGSGLTIDSDLEPFSGTATKGTLEFMVEIEPSIRVNKVNKRLNILLVILP